MISRFVKMVNEFVKRSWWSERLDWGGLLSRSHVVVSGMQVSPESAMTLTVVYACINAISTDVACLPLKVYRRRSDGTRQEVNDHPVARLFAHSPDGESTSMRWRQAYLAHALGWGNGYAEIVFHRGNGEVRSIHLLDPKRTSPMRRQQDNGLYYQCGSETLPPYRCLHLAGLSFDGLKGYSPIEQAREAIGLSLAAERYGASIFGNGARPGGVLKVPQKLKREDAERLVGDWERAHRGAENANRIAILEQGTEWQATTIPPEEAQFLLTRQFQLTEICRMFRIYPHKIADYSQAKLASNGLDASNMDYITTTLMPWCEQFEQEINMKLFTDDERKAGYYVEHNMAALLRGDMRTRAEYYQRMRDLGTMSPNDIRRLENWDPIEDGDIYLVPAQLVSLSRAGQPAPTLSPHDTNVDQGETGPDEEPQQEQPMDANDDEDQDGDEIDTKSQGGFKLNGRI